MTDGDRGSESSLKFPDDYDTDPPVPVQSKEDVANFCLERSAVPDGFVEDEHVAEVGDLTVMRAGIECPRCGSNVFLHPESVVPCNTVLCFECSYSPFGVVWWETPRLGAFKDVENS